MTPMAFIFGSPLGALLAAGAAVSIPIIIHLLNRRRFRVVHWAAMRFLLAAQRKNSRKMRLEQLLLLAVRCALVLLLVLAMTSVMPWSENLWHKLFPDSVAYAALGTKRTHKIIVLDGSFSMALRDGDKTCFDKARAAAEQIVRTSPRGDGFSVVLMAAPPRRVVPEPSEDGGKVLKEIESLRLPHGNADLAATLNTVEALVRASPGKYEEREVYFLTDLQRATWVGRQPAGLAGVIGKIQEAKGHTVILDVGRDNASNTAVADLTIGAPLVTAGVAVPITATVYHYGTQPRDNVRVELLVGRGRAVAADAALKLTSAGVKVERLRPGANTISFSHKFTAPGDYVVQVRLEPDALEVDDVRSVVVTVKKDVPVMLVNGKPAVEALDQATGWARLALDAGEDGAAAGGVVIRPKVLSVKEFNDAGLGDLAPFDCVFFCDVRGFTPAEVRRVEAHLRRGGGAVFFLGDSVDPGNYNELLFRGGKGILPAELKSKQAAGANSYFHFAVEDKEYREPPLSAFTEADYRLSLLGARFRQYFRVKPAEHGGPRTVLSLVPEAVNEKGKPEAAKLPVGDAALVEWQPPLPPSGEAAPRQPGHYRGRVVLFASTANKDWGSFPLSPSYLPFTQELLRFAVSGRLREQAGLVGEPIEEYLSTGAGVDVLLQLPDGRKESFRTEPRDELSVLRWADTDQSGVYRAILGSHPQEHLFAINPPAGTDAQLASESDPARVTGDELRRAYPEWDVQLVTDLKDVRRADGGSADPELAQRPLGTAIARWLLLALLVLVFAEVVLAWHFGHYSAVEGSYQTPPGGNLVLPALAGAFGVGIVLVLGFILFHALSTGDFLGFLPDASRRGFEQVMGIPPPAPGEGSRWRLELSPYLWDAGADPWLVCLIALAGAGLIGVVYALEGRTAPVGYKLLLAGLRVGFLLLLLAVLLPQARMWFERQGWPEVAVIIDDSTSMSTADRYRDADAQALADELPRAAGLSAQDRLALAQALLTRDNPDWLRELLLRRKVKIRVYHCSADVQQLAPDVTEPPDLEAAAKAVRELRADSKNDSSQLGKAVRQALSDFRGSSLAAVIMLTDGINTEGEDLAKVSKVAAQAGVPLFFVGIGDAHETRDLILHDLQVQEVVYVNDKVVFEVRLTGQGYTDLQVPVRLYEKGKEDRALDEKWVRVDPQGKPVKVRLTHQPKEPGEKVYVIKVPVQEKDQEPADNNQLERRVFVREAKVHKVLYVEQYPRYEFRFIKALLERESAEVRGNKAIDLRVLLLEADPEYASEDKSALSDFPTRAELNQFDVVILGDVNPRHDPRMGEHLKDVADFVREKGGGLLMIAGERYAPRVYRETPLRDVLPIDLTGSPLDEPPEPERTEGYKPELTPVGRMHPIFRFSPDEIENDRVWERLREMYWWAEGYQPKRAAEVLAVHPSARIRGEGGRGDEKLPLVVQQFVGAGRSMFFGFSETWRWRFREDELRFNQFWVQVVRYLAVGRLGRVDLRLDKQTPYRRGEPIKVTVRFPDDAPAPPADTEVKVLAERKPLRGQGDKAGPAEVQTLKLAKVEGSRATFEALLTRTPEGEYQFTLAAPQATPKPAAECRVLPPPGEMDVLRMNQADMERAAQETHGKFYTLADADKLLDELPSGTRIILNAPGPPALLWNHVAIFLIALTYLGMEWVLRKRRHLL